MGYGRAAKTCQKIFEKGKKILVLESPKSTGILERD
jgi:hypothetical protein